MFRQCPRCRPTSLVRHRGCRRMPPERCPTVNRIAVPSVPSRRSVSKDNRYCPLPRLFILRIGQCRAVLAENMPRTYRRIGYVDMSVTGSAQYRRHCHCKPLNLSYHVISVSHLYTLMYQPKNTMSYICKDKNFKYLYTTKAA